MELKIPGAGLAGEAFKLYGRFAPILGMFGIDPAQIAGKLTKAYVAEQLRKVEPLVVKRLEADGMTPAVKGDDPKTERRIIRSTIYLTVKYALVEIIPGERFDFVAGILADEVRDDHDDQIVEQVGPEIDRETPTLAVVRTVNEMLLERMF